MVWWNPTHSHSAVPLAGKNPLSHCGHVIYWTCLSVCHMIYQMNCQGMQCWCLNNHILLRNGPGVQESWCWQLIVRQSLMEPRLWTYSLVQAALKFLTFLPQPQWLNYANLEVLNLCSEVFLKCNEVVWERKYIHIATIVVINPLLLVFVVNSYCVPFIVKLYHEYIVKGNKHSIILAW